MKSRNKSRDVREICVVCVDIVRREFRSRVCAWGTSWSPPPCTETSYESPAQYGRRMVPSDAKAECRTQMVWSVKYRRGYLARYILFTSIRGYRWDAFKARRGSNVGRRKTGLDRPGRAARNESVPAAMRVCCGMGRATRKGWAEGRETDLFGFRFLAVLLLELGLESRDVSSSWTCVNKVACVRVLAAWLGSVGKRGISLWSEIRRGG